MSQDRGIETLSLCFGEFRGPEDVRIFMRYAAAKLNERLEAAAFRSYLADALMLMAQGKSWDERWDSISRPAAPVAEADPDEIKSRITKGLKGLAQA